MRQKEPFACRGKLGYSFVVHEIDNNKFYI